MRGARKQWMQKGLNGLLSKKNTRNKGLKSKKKLKRRHKQN